MLFHINSNKTKNIIYCYLKNRKRYWVKYTLFHVLYNLLILLIIENTIALHDTLFLNEKMIAFQFLSDQNKMTQTWRTNDKLFSDYFMTWYNCLCCKKGHRFRNNWKCQTSRNKKKNQDNAGRLLYWFLVSLSTSKLGIRDIKALWRISIESICLSHKITEHFIHIYNINNII